MAGRSKHTDERVETILAALDEGLTKKGACRVAGISTETLRRWCLEDKELAQQVERLVDRDIDAARRVVNGAIDGGCRKTARWLLERRDPEFRTKQDIRVDGDTVETQVKFLERLSPETRRLVREELERQEAAEQAKNGADGSDDG